MTNPTFEGTAPTQPPMAEVVAPPQNQPEPAPAEVPNRNNSAGYSRLVTAGAVVAGLAVVGGAFWFGRSSGESNPNKDAVPAATADGSNINVCPEGMFPNGPYEASLNISTPGDLHTRPAQTLDNANDLTNYLFGKDGVACNSVATESVIKAGYVDMLGDGASRTHGFDVLGSANEQADLYASNKDTAKDDAEKLAEITKNSAKLNDVQIQGAWYKITGVKVGDKVVAEQEKVDVSFDKETVFVIVVGGDARINNQIIVIDRISGQVYGLNSFGSIPEASDQQQAEGEQGPQEGATDTGGSAGPNGNNPEAGPGGVTQSPGEGGGVSQLPGGGRGPVEVPGVTGHPGTTVYVPPYTPPPDTTPPTTPPETMPPKDTPGTLPTPPGGY